VRSKLAVTALIAGLVVLPAVWLVYTLRLANQILDKALAQNLPLAEGPEPNLASSRPAMPVSSAPRLPEPQWTPPVSSAAKRIALAREVETEDPKRSRDLLQEALRLEPNNERVLRMLAQKALLDESFGVAAMLSQRCLSINSANYGCKKVDEQTGKIAPVLRKGSETVDRCLLEDPKDAACLFAKIAISFIAGNISEATAYTERLAQIEPGGSFVKFSRGRLRAATGAYAEARVLFEAACTQGLELACFRAEILRAEGF
jgi:hypothetical protein